MESSVRESSVSNKSQQQKIQESLIIIEKLIKLDKKHSNYNFVDTKSNTKLKVRSNQLHSFIEQNNQGLRAFWKYINSVYLKRIDKQELIRLDFIIKMLEGIREQADVLKEKSDNFQAFENILDQRSRNSYPDDPSASQLNFKNLVKQFQISILVYNFTHLRKNKWSQSELQELQQIQQNKILQKQKCQSLINYLQNEERLVDKNLEFLKLKDNRIDEIQKSIKSLQQELKNINNWNILKLQEQFYFRVSRKIYF